MNTHLTKELHIFTKKEEVGEMTFVTRTVKDDAGNVIFEYKSNIFSEAFLGDPIRKLESLLYPVKTGENKVSSKD